MAYSSATEITATEIPLAGVEVATLASSPLATHGNKIKYRKGLYVEIDNGSGGQITVTIETTGTVAGLSITDRTVTIENNERKKIKLDNPAYLQSDGYVWVVCSGVSSVTIEAFYI